MTVLVTGGAGYIGSHVTRLLRERGEDVVIVDDFSTGVLDRLDDAVVERLDLARMDDLDALRRVLRDRSVDSVIHFAAKKQVAESIRRPAWYAQQNVGGLANLLIAMESEGVDRLVFSSSAAVYGATEGPAITEDAPTSPINPYGATKLIGERLVADAVDPAGLRVASLRYFNVAGAGWDELGDTAVLNLVPMVFERIDAGRPPLIFGDDYDTTDGTCVRDYIHVMDLAEAHLAVLDATAGRAPGAVVYNVGTGVGTSVREMVDGIRAIAGSTTPAMVESRRRGDPAVVVADPSRIRVELGWNASRRVEDILESAWSAHLYQRRVN
jgi:UDP-glucose 4-epimerase